MKYKPSIVMAIGLAFGLASCNEAPPETEPTTPEEQTTEDDAEAPAEETPEAPAETSEVATQLTGKLLVLNESGDEFVESQVDGSLDYYIVSFSASW